MENKREEYLLKKQKKEKERLYRIRLKKIKKISILTLPIIFIAGGIFLWLNYLPENQNQEKPQITVFYSPTCDCCREYILYLKRNGFEVTEEKDMRKRMDILETYQIPSEMEACHTAVIRDYFVEGHMPVEVIKKLLTEKPEISGIALPGMPAGSPGMGGFKTAPFKIYSLSKDQISEYLNF